MHKQATLSAYVTGFLLSAGTTLTAFWLVYRHINYGIFSPQSIISIILGLAVVQLLVQLVFFLHLNKESAPRWNGALLLSAFSIVFIIVVGSLWIMSNLDYNMMHSPQETKEYLEKQQGF